MKKKKKIFPLSDTLSQPAINKCATEFVYLCNRKQSSNNMMRLGRRFLILEQSLVDECQVTRVLSTNTYKALR